MQERGLYIRGLQGMRIHREAAGGMNVLYVCMYSMYVQYVLLCSVHFVIFYVNFYLAFTEILFELLNFYLNCLYNVCIYIL